MHEELFAGLLTNLVAFLSERNQTKISIEVRTDQIDSPIVRNFKTAAKRFLSPYPDVHTVPGWDTVKKKDVGACIKFNIENSSGIEIDIEVENLTIAPIQDGDGYTLAADVLANSLHYLFKNQRRFPTVQAAERTNCYNEPSNRG